MSDGITITKQIHFRKFKKGKRAIRDNSSPLPLKPKGRIPRISRLMALALRLDEMIKEGQVCNQADLAELGFVSRARITQIMNLLNLAPDIQEQILFLPRITRGADPIPERRIRNLATEVCWDKQRQMWSELRADLKVTDPC